MKKKLLCLLILLNLCFLNFNAFSGPIKFNRTIKPIEAPYGDELMEFIGFKNSRNINAINSKNVIAAETLEKGFGGTLSNAHIAVDRSDFYLGIYSFDELKQYKSTKRYVSFVEINELSYTFNDTYAYSNGLYISGFLLSCFGILPIGVPLLCAAFPNKTKMDLKGDLKLYVYDTQKREIVLTTPISFDYTDYYKGKYFNAKTDHAVIDDYYRILVSNLILEKYIVANNFLKNINE